MPFLQPTFLLSLLIAVSVHEWAHAFSADRLGDPTAREEGRLTLNPLAHLDLLGTILFLLVGFGWGKPVPIDPRNFRHLKRDTALTALAGPFSNLILATVAFVGLNVLSPAFGIGSVWGLLSLSARGSLLFLFLLQFFGSALFVNLGLMAFNLLPVAPLDGSKILGAFIPWRYEGQYQELMRRGPFILLFLLIAEDLLGLPLLSSWISGIMDGVLGVMTTVTGS